MVWGYAIIGIITAIGLGVFWTTHQPLLPDVTTSPSAQAAPTPSTVPTMATNYVEPVADFKARILKKTFGLYIDPKTSPVQPERFRGYHTGDDVEYEDVTSEVSVQAIADGTVVLARRATGYGGVLMIEHQQDNQKFTSLYGHLRVSSLLPVGTHVTAGQQVAILGDDKSADTDGERKHLHFGLLKGSSRDIRGYVSSKSELSSWYDPLQFGGESNK